MQLLSLVVFSFGASAFTVLLFFYWRNARKGTLLFRLFTAACAMAFVSNLLPAFAGVQSIAAGLLAPMMFHLTVRGVAGGGRLWLALVALLYGVALAYIAVRDSASGASFEQVPALILGAGAALALARIFSGHAEAATLRRRWLIALFAALLVCAVLVTTDGNPIFEIAPDYLVLLFFAVHLYYSERLAFFDVFLRVGVYCVIGAGAVTMLLLTLPAPREALDGDWSRAWLAALASLPVWLLAPFVYSGLSQWIDRRVLGRKLSSIEAERAFAVAVQVAGTEEHLRDCARRSLGEIFDCAVVVDFAGTVRSVSGELAAAILPAGYLTLHARVNQAPYFSDDMRLLDSLASTLGVVLQSVRMREAQAAREQELVAQAGRAELRALRAQINPHFLFNALNAVAGYIRARPEAADDTLTQLAEVFRYTLTGSRKEWAMLVEEIDFVRAYLAVEKARFGDRLCVSIGGDAVGMNVAIPTMILQPLVENAVKHGTSLALGRGRISIDASALGDVLRIEVRDSGPGFPPGFQLDQDGTGHGLWNAAERLKGYYGAAGALRWQNDGRETCVTLEIPMGECGR